MTDLVGSPKWWLKRLDDELNFRQTDMARFRDLVDDVHPAVDSAETSLKFQQIMGLATTNVTGTAVEVTAERMTVDGVRIGDDPDADKGVWDDVWQRSDFDAGSQEAVTNALIYGRSFVSVSPPTNGRAARLHYEDPRNVVLAYTPEGERAAALKVFKDEWTGDTFGTLYLPGFIIKMRREGSPVIGAASRGFRWIARDVGKADPVVRNPMGEVPFFELQNRPLGSIRSEIACLEIPQRALNDVAFDLKAVLKFGAYRQKWVTGIEVPRDPVTGQPVAPYEATVASLFVAEGADARFGDFGATDPSGYIAVGREIVGHIAMLSRIPVTYLRNNVSNLSAEALALLVSGLVSKCERRVKGYEPALEGAVRLALQTMGDPRAGVANIEIKWAEMETRSMAQSADAAVKLTAGDNPVVTPQTAQEKFLGMTQTERDRDDAWRTEGHASSNLDAVLKAAQAEPLDVPGAADIEDQ